MRSNGWAKSFNLSISTLDENYEHSKRRILLIVFTVLTFLLTLVLNILNSIGLKIFVINSSDFLQSPFHVFQTFLATNLATSLWITYMWIFIFIWQAAWLAYGVSTIFRKSSSDYLYKYPPVMHWLIYLNFSITNLLHIFCLTLWSQNLFGFATFYTALMFISLYIAVFMSLFKLSDYQREMYYTEKTRDVWSIRLLVQNGLFMYAAWSFVMFLITLSITLVHELKFSKENAHLLIIILMFIKLVAYFLVENFVLYRYCKFIFTPWLVYGLFLADLVFYPNKTEYQMSPTMANSYWSYKFSHAVSILNLNYLLEICLVAVFSFLLICKVVKFVWNEVLFQKTFLNSF